MLAASWLLCLVWLHDCLAARLPCSFLGQPVAVKSALTDEGKEHIYRESDMYDVLTGLQVGCICSALHDVGSPCSVATCTGGECCSGPLHPTQAVLRPKRGLVCIVSGNASMALQC